MDDVAVRVEGLSKKYQLGETVSYGRLTESLSDVFRRMLRRGRRLRFDRRSRDELWALKDVSLEVRRGAAVGIAGRDAEFQRECLGKMGDVANEGRTVLFVSHNMAAVSRLCERVFWLDEGRLIMEGEPDQVAYEYLTRGSAVEGEARFDGGLANPGIEEFKVLGVRLVNDAGEISSVLDVRKQFFVEV